MDASGWEVDVHGKDADVLRPRLHRKQGGREEDEETEHERRGDRWQRSMYIYRKDEESRWQCGQVALYISKVNESFTPKKKKKVMHMYIVKLSTLLYQ